MKERIMSARVMKAIVTFVVTMLVASVGLTAFAAGQLYVNEDFNCTTSEFLNKGWVLPNGVADGASIETQNGNLVFDSGNTTSTHMVRYSVTLPQEYVVTWRFTPKNDKGGLRVVTYGNGVRMFLTLLATRSSVRATDGTFVESSVGHQAGKWYTYTAVISGTKAVKISRTVDGGAEEVVFENQPLQTMGGNRVDMFIENGATSGATVDYLRIYSGLCLGDVSYNAQELVPGNTLTANVAMYNGDINNSVSAKFVWVIYNSRSMMQGFSMLPVELDAGASRDCVLNLDLPSTLPDGCFTELYLWDSLMEPMTDLSVFPNN